MGERAFSKTQLGVETVHGTAVAADTLLAGAEVPNVPPDRTPTFPEDNLGVRSNSSRVRIDQLLAKNTISIPDLYFQALPVLLSMGIKGNVTPVEQTASQNDWLWAHTPSQTATNEQDSVTLEVGDDVDAYEIEYCLLEKIVIGGAIAQGGEASPVTFSGEYFGRQVTKSTFTGGIAIPTMTDINAKLSRIYIDALWANRGTTEVTSLLRSWELEIMTGVHHKALGSPDTFFTTHGEGKFATMLTLLFEGNASADAEYDKFLAGTKQAMRISIDSGVQLGSGDNHNLVVDVFGAYEHVTPIDQEDRGNNLSAALFHGLYDPTGAQQFDFQVTTGVAAI